MNIEPLRSGDFDSACACVRAHPRAAAIGAFAYDVLGAQAEGRAVFSGQQFMAQRAQSHGVDRELAATELGNVLTILERGPAERMELALVAAFAARGFDDALEADASDERRKRAERWVAHLDWLELATAYRVVPCLERLVAPERKAVVYEALADAVLRDDTPLDAEADAARSARNAARVAMLGAAGSGGRPALERLAAGARNPWTLAQCRVLLPAGEVGMVGMAGKDVLRVVGHAAPITREPLQAVLRWVSGVALMQWALRVLGFLARFEREVEVELDGTVLRIRRRTAWFGRTLRSVDAVYSVDRISGAFRRARYALVRTLSGMVALSLGILAGGHLAYDAAGGGAPLLFVIAGLMVALGSGLDLALDVLGPAARGRVHLQVDLHDARSVKIGDVPLAEADALLARLHGVLAARA